MSKRRLLQILAFANGIFLIVTGFISIISQGEIMSPWLGLALIVSGIISAVIPHYIV